MPGLSLRYAPDGGLAARVDGFAAALEDCHHDDTYGSGSIHAGDRCLLGSSGYPDYPVRTAADDRFVCALEGYVYDRTPDADALLALARRLFDEGGGAGGDADGADGADERVGDWLAGSDGEFLLVAVERDTGTVALLVDAFGRLPTYYAAVDGEVVVSREVGFVRRALSSPSIDRVAAAQTLLYAYPLGDRTLWTAVRTVPPGSVVRLSPGADGADVDVSRAFAFDLGDPRHADRSTTENAGRLASLFVDACRARADAVGPNVVSLSGGNDSRAVAAGLRAADRPVRAATFRRHDGRNDADVRLAGRVADGLGVDWSCYDVPPVDAASVDRLLARKLGRNHAGMGYVLHFFDALRDDYGGDLCQYTGDGGDKALPDLSPSRSFSDVDDLAAYTVARDGVVPLETAADLVGVAPERVREATRTRLAGYPESTLRDAYVGFRVRERGFNWLFEGEDRNRCHFWSTSPFYATPFFRYAANVPHGQKADDRLYRAFLANLWPDAVTYGTADVPAPVSSARYTLLRRGMSFLSRHPRLEGLAGTVVRGELGADHHPNVGRLLRRQRTCPAVERHLTGTAGDAAAAAGDVGRQGAFLLVTLSSTLDRLRCDGRAADRIDGDRLE